MLSFVEAGAYNYGEMSCEHIAEKFISEIRKRYPGRIVEVSVSEDGENGAIVSYTPLG